MANDLSKLNKLAPTKEPEQPAMVDVRLENGELVKHPLPPINRIKIPSTSTKSATVRWLVQLGYSVGDISNHLGIRYQMVRNIKVTEPKRAAREDMPPLVVEYLPETDEIQDALDGALEADMVAARKERKKAEKEERRNQGLED